LWRRDERPRRREKGVAEEETQGLQSKEQGKKSGRKPEGGCTKFESEVLGFRRKEGFVTTGEGPFAL